MLALLPTLNLGDELVDIGDVIGKIIKDLSPWIGIAFAICGTLVIITAIIELVINANIEKKKGNKPVIYNIFNTTKTQTKLKGTLKK